MRLGHGHRRSVLILWAWTALLSGLVLYPTYTGAGRRGRAARRSPPSAWSLYTVFAPGRRRRRAERRRAATGAGRRMPPLEAGEADSLRSSARPGRGLSAARVRGFRSAVRPETWSLDCESIHKRRRQPGDDCEVPALDLSSTSEQLNTGFGDALGHGLRARR